jgi:hypothetical protein
MEIQTGYYILDSKMESQETAERLLAEAKRLLETGERSRALADLIMVTHLVPDNETAWLLRAKATDDPKEAIDCLDRVLAINPNNAQAREELIYRRMGSLQEHVQGETNSVRESGLAPLNQAASNPIVRIAILVFAVIFCGLTGLTLAGIFALSQSLSNNGAVAGGAPLASPSLAVLQLPPTWTPSPTQAPTSTPLPSPTPSGTTKVSLIVRAGPGTNFPRVGTLPAGSTLAIIGRSADGKFLEIEYPDRGKPGWIATDYVDLVEGVVLKDLAVTTPLPITPAPTRVPVIVVPTPKPTNTPLPQVDFVLGRPIQFIADCGQPWKVGGTVYNNQSGSQRLNGVLVRVWAFNQLQGTIGSGSLDYSKPGYWEWTFSRGSDVQGEVAIVNPDGSLRSQPIAFHLTSSCDGAGAANQIIIDFVGLH